MLEEDQSLLQFINAVEQQSEFRFFYLENWLEPLHVSKSLNGNSLKYILQSVLQGSEIEAVFLYDYAVVFFKDPQGELERDAIIESAAANKIKVDKVVLGLQINFTSGEKLKLSGIVKDKTNQSPVPGVSVYVHGLNINTQTD